MRRRGMFLIMALLTTLIIAMFVGASLALGPASLASAGKAEDRAAALRAADAGLEYAVCRLRENLAWKGDGNGLIVDQPDLRVAEDRGNVVGLIHQSDGRTTQFRLRFNYYDGSAGADGLDDPTSLRFDGLHLSVNNLQGAAQVVMPLADPSSVYQVVNPTLGSVLPARAVGLAVEGRAGAALRDLVNPDEEPLDGSLTQVTAEVIYFNTLGQPVADAAVMSAGNQEYTLPTTSHMVDLASKSGAPGLRVRSVSNPNSKIVVREASGVSQARLKATQARIGGPQGTAADVDGVIQGASSHFVDNQDFYNIKWSDVQQADPSASTGKSIHIPAGTYVAWDDETLHYYDLDFEAYKAHIAANPTDAGRAITSDNLSEIRTGSYGVDPANVSAAGDKLFATAKEWKVEKDLRVVSTPTGTRDFAFLPRRGFAVSPTDTGELTGAGDSWDTDDIKFDLNKTIFSADGDIRVGAEVKSTASTLTSTGNVRLNSKSYDCSGLGDKGLNLYAQGDLTLSSFIEDDNKFGPIEFEGLLYTQKMFQAIAGHVGVDPGDWEKFDLKGALVSYGGDPAAGPPGTGGSGGVKIAGKAIHLEWDDKKLGQLSKFNSSGLKLVRASYALK